MRSSVVTFFLFALAAMTLVSSERLTITRKLKRDVSSAGTVNVGVTEPQGENVVSNQGVLKSDSQSDASASASTQEKVANEETSATLPGDEQDQKKMDVSAAADTKVITSGIQSQSVVDTPAGSNQTQATSEQESPSASEKGSPVSMENTVVAGEEKTTLQGASTNTTTDQNTVNDENVTNSPVALVVPV